MWDGFNLWAVLLAAAVSMVLGFLWYGPLFGRAWMKLSGMKTLKMKSKQEGMWKTYLISFLSSIIMALVLAKLISYLSLANFWNGALLGFTAWIGFVATVTLSMVLWEGKPLNLYLLHNGYSLLSLLLMGGLLAVL